jgi:hypothetical protein
LAHLGQTITINVPLLPPIGVTTNFALTSELEHLRSPHSQELGNDLGVNKRL